MDQISLTTPVEKGEALDLDEFEENYQIIKAALNALIASDAIVSAHLSSKSNPHGVTKTQIGLGNVDNTADTAKPVSTAVQSALDTKMTSSAYTGAFGNLDSPLLHLPLKKNLLTAQGQSVCTFTRVSAATYVDRYGVLKSVSADTPRFTADGLLIEGASTNLLTYSAQFDAVAWLKSECTISANISGTIDPYGTNIADKLIESSASSRHQIYQSVTYTSGTAYTLSLFAKAAERTGVCLILPSAIFGTSEAFFDLSAGTASGSGAAIERLANGWFRCSITKTATSSGSSAVYAMPTSGGNAIYTGDGTSGLYIFGAQLEALPFATSYIPTTTASVTRAGNSLSVLQSDNFPSFSGNLSVCVDLSNLAKHSANQEILRDSGGFRLYYATEGLIAFAFGNKQITSAVLPGVFSGRITAVKSLTMLYLYINGLLVASTVIGTLAVNQTTMQIGSASGTSNYFYGTISNLRIYDRALTAEEVRLA